MPARGTEIETADLARQMAGVSGIEGVSVSGGEPFQQPEALLDLLTRVREAGLSVLVFSGYTLAAVQAMRLGREILALVDVLVAGPYVRARHLGQGLLGSANQRIHFLTARYGAADIERAPRREVILHPGPNGYADWDRADECA